MTDERTDPTGELSPVKRALLQLKEMRARVEAAERARTEPIAIVGMGCRFPGGGNGPDAFWNLLANGVDAIGEVPADRWDLRRYFDPDPDTPGKMCTRYGGFLDDIARFDAAFFGVTPREAAAMDPQQRLLLEVTWEALEHAGLAPDRLFGAPVGVFVAISSADYLHRELSETAADSIDPYLATGGSPSVASGRLSYALGFQGPAVTVDTACSSSLVAMHLAVQSLRAHECEVAVTGGASTILLPELTINFSRARMMAPDGRCKTFDASADGYVRSEGCGIVVLKRLSDARSAGDRILAVIRGSAVNQDGRSSSLTAPNGTAQRRLILDALGRAGLAPLDVDYVEAHGTGTALGDPIELRALGAALTRDRAADRPLLVGSVKTNLGHLEAAAGVAGLMKAVLALQHREIPPHLHLMSPSPLVDWNDLRIVVPTARTSWPAADHPRTAGVSSFGFSGTNAHIVLQEAPDVPAAAADAAGLQILTVSAKSEEALRRAAGDLAVHLRSHPDLPFADVCHTRNAGRSHFAHRLALISDSSTGAADRLEQWLAGRPSSQVVSASEPVATRPAVALVFGDVAGVSPALTRRLHETWPVFREVATGTALGPGSSLAVQCALAELWRSFGIVADVVYGSGVGEVVAACVAGAGSTSLGAAVAASLGSERPVQAPGFGEPGLPLLSGATGGPVGRRDLSDPAHWDAVARGGRHGSPAQLMADRGIRVVLELGF